MKFVSRAGQKLEHALAKFQINPAQKICADLGSNTGGFVDCLLQHGAQKVYAIDTGYGALAWKLRKDPRVIVMERTNAMHVVLPELMNLITIDVAWTRQKNILPVAKKMLAPDGIIISLIKPHYEAEPKLLRRGVLPGEHLEKILADVKKDVLETGLKWINHTESPLHGAGGNAEVLALLTMN